MKGMLEALVKSTSEQTKTINSQNQTISQLVSKVEALEKRIASGSQEQNERIRQLELELEEARS
jgi:coronin-1B/1C/6